MDIKQQIQDLGKGELTALLDDLRLYQSFKKQLGARGIAEYHKIKEGIIVYVVEYFPEVGEELALEKALLVYKTVFGETVDASKVQLEKNEDLKGGMRVYRDDKVVDLSYTSFEKGLVS